MAEQYVAVNGAWPLPTGQLPKPTGQEAIAGARLLMREAFRYFGMKPPRPNGKSLQFKLTRGNRRTKMDWPVFYVNPNENGYWGWHQIAHAISHYAHRKCTNEPPHGPRHGGIEKHLIEFAVARGFLDGKLKREIAPKEPIDLDAKAVAQIDAGLKRWHAKEKRARNAIKKLERRRKYYERKTKTHTASSLLQPLAGS